MHTLLCAHTHTGSTYLLGVVRRRLLVGIGCRGCGVLPRVARLWCVLLPGVARLWCVLLTGVGRLRCILLGGVGRGRGLGGVGGPAPLGTPCIIT